MNETMGGGKARDTVDTFKAGDPFWSVCGSGRGGAGR
jgi:hypothetical protein